LESSCHGSVPFIFKTEVVGGQSGRGNGEDQLPDSVREAGCDRRATTCQR
jgi:hypothetical protein